MEKKTGFEKYLAKEKKLIGLIVASLVLIVVVFGPVMNKLRERVAAKKLLEKQLVGLNEKLSVLSGVDSILINERVIKMERVFPSRKPVVELMASLSSLSAERGLSFGGVTLSPGDLSGKEESAKLKSKKVTVNPELRDLKFGFEIGGDFEAISDFLKDLEGVAPLMKIDKVSLAIKTNPLFERTKTLVVASIDVSAYYQAPPSKLGKVSKSVALLTRKDEILLNKLIGFKTFEAVIPVAETGQADLFGQGL